MNALDEEKICRSPLRRSELVREGVDQPPGVHVDLREKRPAIQEVPHEHVARRPDSEIEAHGELEFRH